MDRQQLRKETHMRTLGTVQFQSEEAAMIAAHTKTIKEIIAMVGVKQECYLYVNESAQIEAAEVATDAYPADELEFIGRYDPKVSG